jgi:16S rRNA (guanine(527)-N(7))-methyltransferase RsmG
MFHVEQCEKLAEWILRSREGEPLYPLLCYSRHLLSGSSKMNLTGFKNVRDVARHLMADSIQPLQNIDVPRGTRILDMGTGAGIPGVPFAVWNPEVEVFCLDSTEKKGRFVERTVRSCGIHNVQIIVARAEELGRDPGYRESFGWILSRAMAPLPVAMECASGLLETGGYAFFYGDSAYDTLADTIESLSTRLGLDHLAQKDGIIVEGGYLFRKESSLDERFPRSWPAMKRDLE